MCVSVCGVIFYADGKEDSYDEAMACWHDANAARRRMTGAPDLPAHVSQAERLMAACAVEAPGALLQIDVPDMQPDFAALLEGLGFSRGFTTARMYRGEAPQIRMDKVFGITTLELG